VLVHTGCSQLEEERLDTGGRSNLEIIILMFEPRPPLAALGHMEFCPKFFCSGSRLNVNAADLSARIEQSTFAFHSHSPGSPSP